MPPERSRARARDPRNVPDAVLAYLAAGIVKDVRSPALTTTKTCDEDCGPTMAIGAFDGGEWGRPRQFPRRRPGDREVEPAGGKDYWPGRRPMAVRPPTQSKRS